jgi:nicotinamide mononucleotide transporter PnuC
MTLPVAVVSTISWFKHPYQDNNAEVEVVRLKLKDYLVAFGLAIIIMIIFYFILKALNTNNLLLSTLSIFTSFLAAYITARRSRFYALFYTLNDIVLIVLWILASLENHTYTSMVICFVAFLVSDLYAFINWGRLEKNQGLSN